MFTINKRIIGNKLLFHFRAGRKLVQSVPKLKLEEEFKDERDDCHRTETGMDQQTAQVIKGLW